MAVTLIPQTLADAIGADLATATRLLAVSTEAVEHYAEDAPESMQNEAAIRMAGWLFSHPPDGLTENAVGDVRARFTGSAALSPLRFSGAMALLSPYLERRGVAI